MERHIKIGQVGEMKLVAPDKLKETQERFIKQFDTAEKRSIVIDSAVKWCFEELFNVFKIAQLKKRMFKAAYLDDCGEDEYFSLEFKKITKEEFEGEEDYLSKLKTKLDEAKQETQPTPADSEGKLAGSGDSLE